LRSNGNWDEKLGPKKIGRPRKNVIDADDMLESRL